MHPVQGPLNRAALFSRGGSSIQMNLNPLLSTLQVMKPLSEVNRRLDNGDHVILGVPDAGKAVTAALLWQRQQSRAFSRRRLNIA